MLLNPGASHICEVIDLRWTFSVSARPDDPANPAHRCYLLKEAS